MIVVHARICPFEVSFKYFQYYYLNMAIFFLKQTVNMNDFPISFENMQCKYVHIVTECLLVFCHCFVNRKFFFSILFKEFR